MSLGNTWHFPQNRPWVWTRKQGLNGPCKVRVQELSPQQRALTGGLEDSPTEGAWGETGKLTAHQCSTWWAWTLKPDCLHFSPACEHFKVRVHSFFKKNKYIFCFFSGISLILNTKWNAENIFALLKYTDKEGPSPTLGGLGSS